MRAVVLAGGAGVRMGGGKAWRELGGRSLIGHVLARVGPQVETVAISVAKGGGAAFAAAFGGMGVALVEDEVAGCGPLAGIAAGLGWAGRSGGGREAVLFVPCDVPFLPPDLAVRLAAGLGEGAMAHARTGGPQAGRAHFGCVLVRGGMADDARAALTRGVRSLRGWMDGRSVAVDWADEKGFINVNTPDDLARARLVQDGSGGRAGPDGGAAARD